MANAHEVRVFAEGALRWIVASGSATTAMTTASAAQSALVGFVQAGTQQTSAQTVAMIKERGVPHHQKFVGSEAVQLQIKFLQAVTANDAALAMATGAGNGASVPMVHMELKSNAVELGATSAIYRQYLFGTLIDNPWTEGEQGNECAQTWQFVRMVGPTASGFLG